MSTLLKTIIFQQKHERSNVIFLLFFFLRDLHEITSRSTWPASKIPLPSRFSLVKLWDKVAKQRWEIVGGKSRKKICFLFVKNGTERSDRDKSLSNGNGFSLNQNETRAKWKAQRKIRSSENLVLRCKNHTLVEWVAIHF